MKTGGGVPVRPRRAVSLTSTFFPLPGLVQRCVVVQKDQLGFGFTVCGERVKLVQNVRAGASYPSCAKYGVQLSNGNGCNLAAVGRGGRCIPDRLFYFFF